jgi:hypothetical protein
MNSHLKSVGKIFLFGLCLSLGACATGPKDEETSPITQDIQDQLGGDVSIKADREYLDAERKNVPAEIKKANDELAFDLQQMGQVKENPERVRSRFQEKVRKARDKFRQKLHKIRDNYTKNERKQREAHTKVLNKERDEFKKQKADRDRNREFYAEQDLKREDFYADSRQKRSEFEEEMRSQSKEFDESMRERVKQFNEELRIYTQRYREMERCKRDKTCTPETSGDGASSPSAADPHPVERKHTYDMREFDAMKAVPATPIGSQSSGK